MCIYIYIQAASKALVYAFCRFFFLKSLDKATLFFYSVTIHFGLVSIRAYDAVLVHSLPQRVLDVGHECGRLVKKFSRVSALAHLLIQHHYRLHFFFCTPVSAASPAATQSPPKRATPLPSRKRRPVHSQKSVHGEGILYSIHTLHYTTVCILYTELAFEKFCLFPPCSCCSRPSSSAAGPQTWPSQSSNPNVYRLSLSQK